MLQKQPGSCLEWCLSQSGSGLLAGTATYQCSSGLLPACRFVDKSLNPLAVQVVRMGDMPDGYEMSIRTPVTPPRWQDFDEVCFVPLRQRLGKQLPA